MKEYWNQRYIDGATGWDLGVISPPLESYFNQLKDKEIKILIPGAGNSYEAEYLHKNGFKNVYVLDISSEATASFSNRLPEFDKTHIINEDFFNLKGSFDLIVEQTFFCAIDIALRPNYVRKSAELLKPNGKLSGLLFDIPLLEDHRPFGGTPEEYHGLFKPLFHIETMERAFNSIEARAGKELWVKMTKK